MKIKELTEQQLKKRLNYLEKTRPTSRMRCEGYVKPGSFMTLGPRKWKQCLNDAIVTIEFEQDDEGMATLPGCAMCWQRCKDSENIKILSVAPIIDNQKIHFINGGKI